MSVQLRDYQADLKNRIYASWQAGNRNVLAVSPCRSGKTVTFTSFSENDPNPSCVQVHRQELVGQIATTHARMQIPHNIIAPQPVINYCVEMQIRETGRSYYDPKAPATVAGVDTLIRRFTPDDRWSKSVQRWTTDECHHVLQSNKWGKGVSLFPNAYGLGVTATPIRGDGKSLHADQGGVFHDLVQGIDMRTLIEKGNICDYRIVAPKSSIDEALLKIGSGGEFTDNSKKKAMEKSMIVGDAVETYVQRANGKQAIAFCVDVKQAEELAERFNQAGIPAIALDGDTPDKIRQDAMDRFQRGEIRVMTNCALFSEGLDLPGVDVCIFCSPTNSFGKFVQEFCRPLTPSPGKEFGQIHDHVGNVLRMAEKYGMPDTPRQWRLWKEEGVRKQREPDAIPMRSCEVCTLAFEALTMTCPYCGHVHQPADRGAPEQVAGILEEMSPELLQRLRMAKAELAKPPAIPAGASDAVVGAQLKRHAQAIMAQNELNEAMQFWGGVQLAAGLTDSQMQAKFYHRFGVDVLTAQGLKRAEAAKLTEEIRKALS